MSGRSAGQPEGQTQRVRGTMNRACPCIHTDEKSFSGGSVVKNPASNAGDAGAISGLGRSPRGGNPTHSSIPAMKIPWTEEPGGLKSTVSQGVGHDQVTECTSPSVPLCTHNQQMNRAPGDERRCLNKTSQSFPQLRQESQLRGGILRLKKRLGAREEEPGPRYHMVATPLGIRPRDL